MSVFIGTSGFSYKHFYKVFYPEDLPRYKMLQYYATQFNTVELNVTFYRIPKETTFRGWNKNTPDNFVFSIKANRRLTHIKRLKCTDEDIEPFFKAISPLKEKIGVILWQLPPSLKKDTDRLNNILNLLTNYTNYRHAFEFRHESWFDDEIYKLLNDYNCTLCFSDWPIDIKIDFNFEFYYIRRHGAFDDAPFARLYTEEEIEKDAILVAEKLRKGKDIYVYYNNDTEGFATINALQLKERVKQLCLELV